MYLTGVGNELGLFNYLAFWAFLSERLFYSLQIRICHRPK